MRIYAIGDLHLSFNEKKFRVTHDSFASNMMPDIYVVERGAG